MESLYKVGDEVLIKSVYDPGCTEESYRFGFVAEMLNRYGGKVYKIIFVRKSAIPKDFDIPDDGYIYGLDGNAIRFYWASSMFEPEF